MKTTIKTGILSMLISLIVPFTQAQIAPVGNYTGQLPKIEISSSIDLERNVNLTIGGKTIAGKVSLKMEYPDIDSYINTIRVDLKGEGIDIQTSTISSRSDFLPEGSFIKQSYIFDVYAGTINGKQINGFFAKAYNDKLFGSIHIADKEMYVVKKSKMNKYELSYGDMMITTESKGGMNKQGHPKVSYTMMMGTKSIEGVVNLNGDLKNHQNDFIYELAPVQLTDDELSLWLFFFFSSDVFSGRTDIKR